MSHFKDRLEDRLQAAQKSKAANLARFAARPQPDDPASQKKRAEREAIQAARAIRQAEAEAQKQAARAAREQQAAEALVLAAQEQADAVVREAELKQAQKQARDARYAARKARQS